MYGNSPDISANGLDSYGNPLKGTYEPFTDTSITEDIKASTEFHKNKGKTKYNLTKVKDKSNQMITLLKMLDYIGCEDNTKVVEKIHYWDFPISLCESFASFKSLTAKQEGSLTKLILKHTGVRCTKKVLTHTRQYESSNIGSEKSKTRVEHNFHDLKVIQLFDLPFEDGSVNEMVVYPYNAHSIVFEYKSMFYKIPNPESFAGKILGKATIRVRYKRTKVKGFLTLLNNGEE